MKYKYEVTKWGSRYFAVVEAVTGILVCVCLYRKGAVEVLRRLEAVTTGKAVQS
jgi:hypothetical protein